MPSSARTVAHTRPLPAVPARPTTPDLADRVRGMLLGVAIGDALGNTSEAQLPSERLARHGWIDHYLPNRHFDGKRVGGPSDDTQLTCWTLDQLLADGRLDPGALAARFTRHRIFGIGTATRAFVAAYRAGAAWDAAGTPSAGNGALMRAAPLLLPHLAEPSAALWRDVIDGTVVTHNDGCAIAVNVAWVGLLWALLAGERPDHGDWWIDRMLPPMAAIDHDTRYTTRVREGPLVDWAGPLSALLDGPVRDTLAAGQSVADGQAAWYSGAFLLETVPTVLHILTRHWHEPRHALLVAVNDTKDNDTVAAIVGAALGALHGSGWFDPRWVANLSGRIDGADDGRLVPLVDAAITRFVPAATTVA
jgi:ADP-ribosylglycohydrolase